MTAVSPEKSREIADLVRRYLEPHQLSDYRLEVISDAIEQDDEWYYVVVEPSREDVRAYDYGARLVEAEMDPQEKEGLKVLLVPVLPN